MSLSETSSVPDHLPGCTSHSLAEMYPDEEKPAHLSDHQWTNIRFSDCAEGCPRAYAAIKKGRELAKEHGWT